jgi:hypothetical protein
MSKTPTRLKTARLSPEQSARAAEVIQGAVERFTGSFDKLKAAIGLYMLGHYVGWRVLVLLHSKTTIRKYERILDIKVREEFPEMGPESDRSIFFRAAQAVSNFWKVVSGEIKLDMGDEDKKHISAS